MPLRKTSRLAPRSLSAFLAVGLTLSLLALSLQGLERANAAEQHANANVYAFWKFDPNSGFRDIEQKIKVRKKAPFTFWAQFWRWTGQDVGGYVGLQTDGNRFDGSTGETAIFSLWDASDAKGPSCGTFGGEGVGYSCRLAYPIKTKHSYRLRVERGRPTEQGQWWRAAIKNMTSGRTRTIGSIRVASGFTLMGEPMNFSEYFGPAVPCDEVPVSVALWSAPGAQKKHGGGSRYTGVWDGSSRGECTGGSVESHKFGKQGVKVTQGGPR